MRKTTLILTVCIVLMVPAKGYAEEEWTYPLDYPGANLTYPLGIDGDTIVGYYDLSSGDIHGFVYDGITWTPLDVPGSDRTRVTGIEGSRVVGGYRDGGGTHGFIYDLVTNAWTYPLDVPGSQYTLPYGIQGDTIVGHYDAGGVERERAFLYDVGTDTWTCPLNVPGAKWTYAYRIDGDTIVGHYDDTSGIRHGFLYDVAANVWTYPLDYPGETHTSTLGIEGENIVGFTGYTGPPFHGFLYDGTTWTPLDAPGATATFPSCIKGGKIIGAYRDSAGRDHGFVYTIAQSPECQPGYRYLTQWGEYGTGDGQFSNPHCLDVDSSGRVYVADWYNHRVQKFSSDGTYVTQWGTFGSGPGEFQYPVGVAIDSSDNVYVTDWDSHRVQKFTSGGTWVTQRKAQGSGNGEFEYVQGIAVDSAGFVYVCDYGNNRIQKFTNNLEYVTQWGSCGSGDSQFIHPIGIEVDSGGSVYVVDSANHRVQKFSSDGVFITKWGEYGTGDGQFNLPSGIGVDSSGLVYIADNRNNRVQVFTSEGEFVDKFGTYGNGDGQFFHPMDLALDSAGNAYVSDYGNNRIQKFSYVSCNEAPVVDAGENVQILSVAQGTTVISGTGSDPEGDTLAYRWVEGEVVLLDWTPVPETGESCLDLAIVPALSLGNHTLSLEVREIREGGLSASDDMVLTVENSPPEAQPAPTHQVVEIGLDPVVVAADVSDFDGDTLLYKWVKDGEVLESGIVKTVAGGDTVTIPDLYIAPGDPRFPLGVHTIELIVDDYANAPVPVPVTVEVKDSTAPSISPLPSVTILWPPNHTLQPVTIAANAFDNGGGAITLAVTVVSSEPPDADGDGNTIPDYYIDSIDNETGIIELRLRSERSGKGDGRTYTIRITAADESGNSSEAIVSIRAPHDKRKK